LIRHAELIDVYFFHRLMLAHQAGAEVSFVMSFITFRTSSYRHHGADRFYVA